VRQRACRCPRRAQVIPIGTGEILRSAAGDDPAGRVALLGYGSGVGKALDAAELLAVEGIEATVVDARFAKPIDRALVLQLAAEHELLVTVEEGVLAGGFGSAVWETLNEAGAPATRIIRIGLPDRYVTHGTPALLHEEVGFTAERIAERVASASRQSAETSRSRCSAYGLTARAAHLVARPSSEQQLPAQLARSTSCSHTMPRCLPRYPEGIGKFASAANHN